MPRSDQRPADEDRRVDEVEAVHAGLAGSARGGDARLCVSDCGGAASGRWQGGGAQRGVSSPEIRRAIARDRRHGGGERRRLLAAGHEVGAEAAVAR